MTNDEGTPSVADDGIVEHQSLEAAVTGDNAQDGATRSKFLHRREVALSAIHAEPSARQTVRTEGAQTIPDIAEDKPAPTHDESTVEASVEAAEAKAMRSLIERKEVSVDQKLEQQPDLPARTDSLFYNTHETRQAETVSIGDQLALLMHEAAKDMDSAELRSMINARDKQVSSLSLENEQLKRMQDEMMTKIELQTQRIFELRFANKAMKTVNRSLVEDAEAYHMLRSKQRKIFLPSQAPVIVDENGEEIVEGPAKDSAVASLDHSRNASPSISQRSSLDVEANEESSRQIISALRDEIKGLNLYINKITSRILSDDYLEQVLVNDPPTDEGYTNVIIPSCKRHNTLPSLPALTSRSNVPDLLRKRPSLAALSFFKREPSSPAVEAAPCLSPLMIDSTKEADEQLMSPSWFQRMSLFGMGQSPVATSAEKDDPDCVQMTAVSENERGP